MNNPLNLIFALVMFGAMLGLLAILVRSLVVSVTFPRRMSGEAACDRCKYPIAGLGGWTCPECGADLRKVGIATPTLEMKRRGSTGDALAAWTLLTIGLIWGAGVAATRG